MAEKNITPVEDPNDPAKDNEDMTVANGKAKQCKFIAIQNYQDLYSSLLLASSSYKNKSSLEGLYKLTEKLCDSADLAWDALMETPDKALKDLGNTAPQNINVENVMAMESVEAYVPVCPVLKGTAEAIAIINDWKTKVRDIQSKLRVRINSLKLDAEKISKTEQKTSNAFNDILFFITNDPVYHGDKLIKNCKTCEDVAGMTQRVLRLRDLLTTFTDSSDSDANINACNCMSCRSGSKKLPYGFGGYYGRYFNIPNLYKWKSVIGRCLTALQLRNSTNPDDQRRLHYV